MSESSVVQESPQGDLSFKVSRDEMRRRLMHGMQRTGRIFYIIAVLSMVNTALAAAKTGVVFLGGLGLSLAVDALLLNQGPQMLALAGGINFVAALAFAAIGAWVGKGSATAFKVGIGLYALDSGILLLLQDVPNFIFHVFFLFLMFRRMRLNAHLHASLEKINSGGELDS